MGNLNFDASAPIPSDAIPAGTYTFHIKNAEVRPTKAQDGSYVYLEMQVVEGPHAGRMIFLRINIANPNKQAEAMGKRLLHSLCHAAGYPGHVDDTSQFLDKIVRAKVTIDKTDQNQVSNFESPTAGQQFTVPAGRPAQGGAGAAQGASGVSAGATAAGAAQEAPWAI